MDSNIRMQINKLKSYNSVTPILIFRVINLVFIHININFCFFTGNIRFIYGMKSYAASFSFCHPIIMLSIFCLWPCELFLIMDYSLKREMNHFILFSCFCHGRKLHFFKLFINTKLRNFLSGIYNIGYLSNLYSFNF